MLKVDGILSKRCKMFDTPGVPHPYQLHARLSPEEVRPGRARCALNFKTLKCLLADQVAPRMGWAQSDATGRSPKP